MSSLFDRVAAKLRAGHERALDMEREDPRVALVGEFKPAAVLVAFTQREQPGLLLLHRPSTMRAHPGQVAFPGGRIDPGENAVEAALREAREELGIDPGMVRIVGETDSYRTGTGYDITPVVGIVPDDLAIDPNPAEVAQWFEAPAAYVLDPANQRRRSLDWQGRQIGYWEIQWRHHRIWGVTAGLLRNLSLRLDWHG